MVGVEESHEPEIVPLEQAGLLGQMALEEQAERKEHEEQAVFAVPVVETLSCDDLRLHPQLHD